MVNPNESLSRLMQLDSPFVSLAVAKAGSDDVWPSPAGRSWLNEAASLGISPMQTQRGDFWASVEGWRLHSAKDALFRDQHDGRRRLSEWVRAHTTNAERISARRALILDASSAGYRLWQLVNAQSTLRERLDVALPASVEVLGHELERIAEHLVEAEASFRLAEFRVRSNLWTVSGDLSQRPRFVGLMPAPGEKAPLELQGAALIERELRPVLGELARVRADYPALQSFLRRRADQSLSRSALSALA